jgi:tRNA-splicing ligase RtcB (3'-phosphate/5'-hydroxy nucleic acid ligase)
LPGGDLDESPMAYRRLDAVLTHHHDSIRIQHRLHPVIVVMAGPNDVDPFKD